MPLDVYIMREKRAPLVGDTPVLQLDSAYLVFLDAPLRELQNRTGQIIDLYDDAIFGGVGLDAMRETISQARLLLAAQPDVWRQRIATQIQPQRQKTYSTIHKAALAEFLNQWESAVNEAQKRDALLIFFGD